MTQKCQLRLQDSKTLQGTVQSILETHCYETGIAKKLSYCSSTDILEKISCGSGIGILEKLSCGFGIGLVEYQPSKNHQSPKGESHVTVQ